MRKLFIGFLCIFAVHSANADGAKGLLLRATVLQQECAKGLSMTAKTASDPSLVLAYARCEAYILGYIYGEFSAANYLQSLASRTANTLDPLFEQAMARAASMRCAPADTTVGQLAAAVAEKFIAKTYDAKDTSTVTVRQAAREAFPCKDDPPQR
ncbi:Rap1a/Tai family immunity protein [Achromobacter seleniivolatilans]|uniref:Rap1a/Tai family immunity protein n=1 Tax=Achromobacter seleniivolatilans TaxID=3047478 RepID=A0ABY9M1N5_9BURK|nr:Rap1a/Tai family immunity protein [Achromobacter sp. R39]WMD20894.1 Rap1a/Tai family immunity protein [Achromobacter sp. R39]